MEPFVQRQERFFEIAVWKRIPDLVAGFSTRLHGVSETPYAELNVGFHVGDDRKNVLLNRQLLANDLRFPLDRWVCGEQVHRNRIQKVTARDAGKGAIALETSLRGVDGLYTAERNLLLTCLFADCVPIYFLENEKPLIGIAHAGWRGTVQKIAVNMIDCWIKEEGVRPENIEVVIGPAISKQQYEVDQNVIAHVDECLTEEDKRPYDKKENGNYLLDLRELNKQLLVEAGLKEEQIKLSSLCTATDRRFFSHRRDRGKTGRMIGFIGRR